MGVSTSLLDFFDLRPEAGVFVDDSAAVDIS
jgi:hypothetical protein